MHILGSGGVHLLHDLESKSFFVIEKDIRNERYAIVASFSAVKTENSLSQTDFRSDPSQFDRGGHPPLSSLYSTMTEPFK